LGLRQNNLHIVTLCAPIPKANDVPKWEGDLSWALGRKDGPQQIVVASRDGGGALHVAVFPGDANGMGASRPVVVGHKQPPGRAKRTVSVSTIDQ